MGGVLSVVQGGKLGHGFVSAGFSKGAMGFFPGGDVASRAFMSGAINGVVTEISGGKFANGFSTGVFQSLFNDAVTNWAKSGQSLDDYMKEKYGKLPITDEERDFAKVGDRKAFWSSRLGRGDPLAKVALGIVNDESYVGFQFVGGWIANRLTGLEGEALNALGVDLMRAHISAVDFDFKNTIGIPGLLSPTQAAAYHHVIFREHGLGSWRFGGTLLYTSPNLMRGLWCTGCDYTGATIR